MLLVPVGEVCAQHESVRVPAPGASEAATRVVPQQRQQSARAEERAQPVARHLAPALRTSRQQGSDHKLRISHQGSHHRNQGATDRADNEQEMLVSGGELGEPAREAEVRRRRRVARQAAPRLWEPHVVQVVGRAQLFHSQRRTQTLHLTR